ncbi:polyketide synthase (plasmid) [Pseudonocardia sp. EC080610-09]|uniref:TcmI family type II polyketide cyclase n=1 Tax=unclassified Pseudonocardia TaxID=2619320 RepID=UPI000705FC78|nr:MULTISPECIES: TcmI family type II polyketide cyclase [unclassified Pseudonocardia]ALL79484.1 polyketide synthase [Pseudonocardia sp. EC080610-09]ALL85563.1 polyketide synthase [Pseudonocardia sp. EC080619-01]
MHSTLIVARMRPESADDVARIFGEFDTTEMPDLMGTRRRQLFHYNGLYFHMQDFADDDGIRSIEEAQRHPLFVNVSEMLKAHIGAYDPETWQSPKDAIATSFYRWERHT